MVHFYHTDNALQCKLAKLQEINFSVIMTGLKMFMEQMLYVRHYAKSLFYITSFNSNNHPLRLKEIK